jgi:microcin C transport system permease protein
MDVATQAREERQPQFAPPSTDTFLRTKITPLTRRRIEAFKRNKRGYWSMWIFIALFVISMFGEFIANDRPLVVNFQGEWLFPTFVDYPETKFGGFFETATEYRDPFVKDLIETDGWMVWPMVRFSYNTINYELNRPVPAPPSPVNWVGTDDQARDVFARALYGFRISVLFGFVLVILTSIIGVIVGASQGFFGGWWDLGGQRFMEIWGSVPTLFLIIILSSVITPSFWTLLGILLLFGWMGLVDLVRAEFLRGRNIEYVMAARGLGVSDAKIMFRHILPNAMVATITFMPFILAGSVTILTSLDFLGFGLPAGSPSLGEMLNQGKANLQAPWLGMTAFVVLGSMLVLLVFTGEAFRDAFDPRKTQG